MRLRSRATKALIYTSVMTTFVYRKEEQYLFYLGADFPSLVDIYILVTVSIFHTGDGTRAASLLT